MWERGSKCLSSTEFRLTSPAYGSVQYAPSKCTQNFAGQALFILETKSGGGANDEMRWRYRVDER